MAIDRTSTFAVAEPHERITRRMAGDFLRRVAAAVPYRIHTVLTGEPLSAIGQRTVASGTHLTDPAGDCWTPADIRRMRAAGKPFRAHGFELACADLDIDHHPTKPNHWWTNGQVERMNRTLKETTVRRDHYGSPDALRAHLQTFLEADNVAKRLKTLKGKNPVRVHR